MEFSYRLKPRKMKIINRFIACTAFMMLSCTVLSAQTPVSQVLLSSAVDCRKKIEQVSAEIVRYQNRIVKSRNTIANSTTIQKKARETGNKEAERVATEAMANSEKTIKECNNFIVALKEKRSRYQSSLSSILRAMNSGTGQEANPAGTVLGYTGTVNIRNASGAESSLTGSSSFVFGQGDEISTSSDGSVSLNYLEGRGSLTVGPGSQVRMTKDKDSTDVLEVIKGKVYSGVLKADEYEKKMMDLYQKFSADSLLKSVEPYKSYTYEQWVGFVRARALRYSRKFEVRTPSAVLAVRGTKFTVEVTDDNTTELRVIEGRVEYINPGTSGNIMVESGQVCRINKNEGLPVTQPVDTLNINKWWQYEK